MPDIATGGGTPAEPKMVEVELDGRKVAVPESAAELLKQKEHDLASRNERILAEERNKLATERAEFQDKFKKDTAAYNELLKKGAKDLSQYDPLTLGGTGRYIGTVPEPDDDDEPVTRKAPANTTFAENELTAIRNELASIKQSAAQKEAAEARERVSFMEDLQARKFAYADADAVLSDMRAYHEQFGRPPSEAKITEFLKKRHDKIAKQLPAGSTAPKPAESALPDARQTRSTERTPAEKLPALNDHLGWADIGRNYLRGLKG